MNLPKQVRKNVELLNLMLLIQIKGLSVTITKIEFQ